MKTFEKIREIVKNDADVDYFVTMITVSKDNDTQQALNGLFKCSFMLSNIVDLKKRLADAAVQTLKSCLNV